MDLCLCRTQARFSQEGTRRVLTLDPVDIEFRDLTVTLVSTITFPEDTRRDQVLPEDLQDEQGRSGRSRV